jgi:hypothetical protein
VRLASDDYASRVIRGAASLIEVTAYLGSTNLGAVPIVIGSWSITDSGDQQVPGQLEFEVPNTSEWRPTRWQHPLAGRGHRLRVRVGTSYTGGSEVEWLNLGWFLPDPPTPNGETQRVSARGMLALVDESRLLEPYRAGAGATRYTVATKLLAGLLPIRFKVANETTPGATVVEQDRLDGVQQLADAWPARLYVDDEGVATFAPVWNDITPGNPVKEILDGAGGTLVRVTAAASTARMYNGYRVTRIPEGDAAPVSETVTLKTGNLRWGGVYGWRPGFYESPLLSADRGKLRQVATAMLDRSMRRADSYQVTAAPDARLQVGDVVRVRSVRDGLDFTGRAVEVTHTRTALDARVSWLAGTR